MDWIVLGFWLVICFAVAGISGRWTATEIPNWYRTLVRPSIAPPNWIFGPVWTVLYALMAVAAWRASLTPSSPERTVALAFFVIQLLLNFAWSLIFFRWHRIGWALAEVVTLWAAILLTTMLFARVSTTAAWLMTPYLLWVSFASILNGAFWQLNRSPAQA